MKKIQFVLFNLFLAINSSGQFTNHGWYYFQYPASEIFGIGFNNVSSKADPIYIGTDLPIQESDLKFQKSANELLEVEKGFKKLIIGSLFSNHPGTDMDNPGISINVHLKNIRKIRMDGSKWLDMPSNTYHAIEGLQADSVWINGAKMKGWKGNTSLIETIIKLFASDGTVAFKVVDAIGNKTDKETGFISYETGNKDSFSILIARSEIYFAARFAKHSEWGGENNLPVCHPYNDSAWNIRELSGRSYSFFDEADCFVEVNNRIYPKVIFAFDPNKKIASITVSTRKLPQNKYTIPDTFEVQEVNDDLVTFKGIYSLSTNNEGARKKYKAKQTLIMIPYEFTFNPKAKLLKIAGYQKKGRESYSHTCVYTLESNITLWPDNR